MTPPKYDFIEMERTVSQAYSRFKSGGGSASRHDLFVSIKDLAYAILMVGDWNKYGVDYEKVSYEYGLYMFERIVTSTFSPSDSFPWTEYIRKSIIYGVKAVKNDELWFDFVEKFKTEDFSDALKEIVADEEIPDSDYVIDQGRLGERIHSGLRMFYTQKEINRLYPLVSDLLFSNKDTPVSNDLPLDIQDFMKVLICVGKRLDDTEDIKFSLTDLSVETLKKAINVSVRSTLFLAASVKLDYFPRDLLLALDIHSLYRLLSIRGGTSIKLPPLKHLERLIGAVVITSYMLLEGKSYDEAVKSAKEELDFDLGTGSVRKMVSRIIEAYNLFENKKESDSLLDIMISALNVMKNLANKIPELVDQGASPDNVLRLYKEMSSSLNNLTNSLIKIGSSYTNKKMGEYFKK
jgi:hypothetical protein